MQLLKIIVSLKLSKNTEFLDITKCDNNNVIPFK